MITRRDCTRLADLIRQHNRIAPRLKANERFTRLQLELLAEFCGSENPGFNKKAWLGYIAGKCGPQANDVVVAGAVYSTAPESE
jgi:hypothetical protein